MAGIKLENVSFTRNEQALFRGLTFEFQAHTLTLLRGDSGSGKSTLLRLIAGFAPLTYEGDIMLGSESLKGGTMTEKASRVGMVFQNPGQQFTMKTLRREMVFALENLHVPLSEMSQRMETAISLVGTEQLIDRELMSLSGGEKQKASLTVLLAMNAPVLLLDEPFASIDPRSRRELIQTLGRLRDHGKTIIVCDHDLSDYDGVVDSVVTLEGGACSETNLEMLTHLPNIGPLTNWQSNKTGFLSLSDVSYKQGNRLLLEDTSHLFQKGITTLTGDNGTGKSTLFRAMVQVHSYQGKMMLNNHKLRKRRRLYRELTLAVQEADKQFVTLTPEEEFGFSSGIRPEMLAKQQEGIQLLGLEQKLKGSVFHLSEGQKKMVQLLTMLSLDVSCLLLDEPFSGLDERACDFFSQWMKEKSSYQDFIVISHRLTPLVGISDHHVQLENQTLQSMEAVEGSVLNDDYQESYLGLNHSVISSDH